MSIQLDNLRREVQETRTAVDSIRALVRGLAQQIRDSADDPAALEALAAELDTLQTEIATDVAENTDPTPTPQPE